MENLKNYNDNELSLRVFNDEYFYVERGNVPYLLALIAEEFEYTPAHLAVLLEDLADDAKEAV